jgi:hypothetical protein
MIYSSKIIDLDEERAAGETNYFLFFTICSECEQELRPYLTTLGSSFLSWMPMACRHLALGCAKAWPCE